MASRSRLAGVDEDDLHVGNGVSHYSPRAVANLAHIRRLLERTGGSIAERAELIRREAITAEVREEIERRVQFGVSEVVHDSYRMIVGNELVSDRHSWEILVEVIDASNAPLVGARREEAIAQVLSGITDPNLRYYSILMLAFADRNKTRATVSNLTSIVTEMEGRPEPMKVEILMRALFDIEAMVAADYPRFERTGGHVTRLRPVSYGDERSFAAAAFHSRSGGEVGMVN